MFRGRGLGANTEVVVTEASELFSQQVTVLK